MLPQSLGLHGNEFHRFALEFNSKDTDNHHNKVIDNKKPAICGLFVMF